VLDHSCQVQRAALSEHRGDFYDTPLVAVHALLRAETLPRRIWEPACGIGNIAGTLIGAGHAVFASDLNDRGYGQPGIDFLLPGPPVDCDAIVTNPPFSLAEEFVEVALARAPMVVMLLRLAFFESERRSFLLEDRNLARIHVFANRLPDMSDKGAVNCGMAMAWFVWDQSYVGPTLVQRIKWKDHA
jgi:hypothetical protein